jgi:hypothetical protein
MRQKTRHDLKWLPLLPIGRMVMSGCSARKYFREDSGFINARGKSAMANSGHLQAMGYAGNL